MRPIEPADALGRELVANDPESERVDGAAGALDGAADAA